MTDDLNLIIQKIKNGEKIDQGTFAFVLKQPQTTKETKIHEILLHFVQNPDKQPLEDVIGYLKAAIWGITLQKNSPIKNQDEELRTHVNFKGEGTAVRTLQLAGNLRNRRCHPSAPTLGSSLSIIIKTSYFNIKQLLLYSPT